VNQRQTEFFGPDLGRGPFSSQRIETSALQIATALAQIRAPVTRSDDDLRAHADFIRELADHLCPDWAAALKIAVDAEQYDTIHSSIIAPTGEYSLLDVWLADSAGGGVTGTAPGAVTFNIGTIIQTITANKRYLILTSATGVVDVTVSYTAARSWYWAVTRYGRVYYSSRLYFA
jgi:hypothetical protein